MIEQLFGSKTRVKLLGMFYSNPNRSFYVREITRKIDEQINSVRRELANLLSIGIISSDTNNNRLYYEVNQEYEYYKALSAIFGGGATKTSAKKKHAVSDELEPLDQASEIRKLGNVELAIFTGQFTRDDTPGIDILLVGDLNPTKLEKYIAELEKDEAKELRYTVLSSKDFAYRQQVKDRFLNIVFTSKNQILVDKNGLFNEPEDKEEE